MHEHEVSHLIQRLAEAMDPALEYDARHEDYTVEFPQSGERMTRDGLRAMQETFPGGKPRVHVRRLTGAGDVWVSESVIEYPDGKVLYGAAILQFRNGKMWRDTCYFAEPFEAPQWRSQWVERIDEAPAGSTTGSPH